MFGLFLVGNMDKLVATRVCTGLSYLNTVKQAMAILNIGLSGIEISIDPNTEEQFLSKFLKGAMSMKTVRQYIDNNDT